jgi:DNA-binding beta-propeller fold protein YncE
MIRKISLTALLLLAVFSAVYAAPGDVDHKIPLEISHPTGIAWTGSALWVADRKADLFYEIDPVSGRTLREIESPGWFPSGLAWDGSLLWSTDPGSGAIYATDPETGQTVKTLESPTPGPTGIAWNGANLWICDNSTDMILNIDPADGTTIDDRSYSVADISGAPTGSGTASI